MLFEIPIIVVLLQSIPEGFFIVIVGLKLFNIDIEFKRAMCISIIHGIFAFIIRKLIVIFGLHTIISIIILIFLVKFIRKISLFSSIVSILAGSLLIGIFQGITVPFVLKIYDISFQQLSQHSNLNIIAAIPTFILCGISYFILSKTGFYLYNANLFKKG